MKKKIVNAVLSVAVVTSMMFAVTACGSKDNANTKDVSVVNEENKDVEENKEAPTAAKDAEAESTTEAESSEAASSEEAAGNITLNDWIFSDEAVAVVDYLNANLDGMSVGFEADGDVFSMVFTMDEVIDVADDAEEAMKTLFDSQASMFESIRDQLIEQTGNPNVSVRIVYLNGDGSEVYSQEF